MPTLKSPLVFLLTFYHFPSLSATSAHSKPSSTRLFSFEPMPVYKLRDMEGNLSKKTTYSGVRSPQGPSEDIFQSLGAISQLIPTGKDPTATHHTEAEEICGHIRQQGASAQGSNFQATVQCGQTWVQSFARC